MSDYNELTQAIKKAATDAIKSSKPMELCFGKVISASPLRVFIDQKFEVGEKQLLVTSTLKDREITMQEMTSQGWYTRTFRVNDGLKDGDSVLMVRMQGGQRYIIIDKVVD